jgi:hypothetical protein
MKPRISLSKGLAGYFESMWWCVGSGAHGVGSTPKLAYKSWLDQLSGMQNAYPGQWVIQNTLPQQPTFWERWFG